MYVAHDCPKSTTILGTGCPVTPNSVFDLETSVNLLQRMFQILLVLCMAVLVLIYLNLSRGIVSRIYIYIYICYLCRLHRDTQHSSLGSIVFAHLGSIKVIT